MPASSSLKSILEKFSDRATLLPGLSDGEIAQFAEKLPGQLPDEVRALLKYSSGFSFDLGFLRQKVATVRFQGTEQFAFPDDAIPRAIDLIGDGCGNFWVVDIDSKNGKWGAVYFACHDPAVIAVQAGDLGQFIMQALDPSRSDPPDALKYVAKEAARRIWQEDPWLVPVREACESQDAAISNFAKQLPETFYVADLRSKKPGSGFSWGLSPNFEVRRAGTESIFAVQQKAGGFFEKLLSGRKK
jgi:hypothetical protein